jgi:hypothetical protein
MLRTPDILPIPNLRGYTGRSRTEGSSMIDERRGSEDPVSTSDEEQDRPVDEDVIDISDNSGPELTTNVDDVDPGSAGGAAKYTGVEPPD